MEKTITHIAFAPSNWFSILASAFEFSKRLASLRPDFQISFFIPIFESPTSALKALLETHDLPSNLNPILLPPVTKQDMPPGPEQHNPFLQMKATLTKSRPHIYEYLKSLSTSETCNLAALIADEFTLEVLDFAKELNTQCFIYMATCATALSFLYHLPQIHEKISCDFKDLSEPIQLPGCVQLQGRDLPAPVQIRSTQAYEEFLQMTKRIHGVDGFLVNSFVAMEEGPAKAFRENNDSLVYLVGPVTQKEYYSKQRSDSDSNSNSNSECLRWLEKQPPNSVLYVSFGGGAKLSQKQTNELALGLELSGMKFLWVLSAPCDATNYAIDDNANEDPLRFLPQGFLERTKERGLVVPLWAPQDAILSQNSIGGFLSHCDWNTVMQTVQHGVPMIVWPLFAEQKINATLLTNGLKVALWPQVNEKGIVEKEEISKVIKNLMEDEEGKEIYKRMECLKDAVANAVKDDGSSTKAILELATKWKKSSGLKETN